LLLYFGITVVGLSAVTPKELGTTYVYDPVAAIAGALPFGGKWLMSWVGLLGAILLFISANAGLLGSSRLAYNMGEYYQLPRFLSTIHPKFRTPYVALLVFAILAILLILLSRGHLSFLADLYNFGAMIAFFSTNLSLIVLRIKQPDMKRPFSVSINIPIFGYRIPISAIIGCIATCSVWVLIVLTKLEGRLLGLSWMAIGLGLFFLYRRRKGLVVSSITVEKIKIPHLEPLVIDRVLVSVQSLKDKETVQLACEVAKKHKARLTLLYVMEVPFSIPVDASLPSRTAHAETVIKRSEAIARQWDIPIETLVIRGRFFNPMLLGVVNEKKIDLVIAAWKGKLSEKLVKICPCRVWLMRN
jgi:APA family basic amino acid/polyamine antiporter